MNKEMQKSLEQEAKEYRATLNSEERIALYLNEIEEWGKFQADENIKLDGLKIILLIKED